MNLTIVKKHTEEDQLETHISGNANERKRSHSLDSVKTTDVPYWSPIKKKKGEY